MNDAITDSLKEALGNAADGITSGRVDPTEWHNAVAAELFAHHLAAYADAAGLEIDDPKALAAAKKIVGAQVDYLNKFTDDIENGRYTDRDDALAARLDMYAGALRGTYYSGRYPSLSQVPGDGGTQCLTNCKCTLSEEEDGIHWVLNDEGCPDCQAMAEGSPYGRE